MKILGAWFLVFWGVGVFVASAQDYQHHSVYVKQDARIDTLQKSFRQANLRRGMQGFRVQIYTASGNRSKLLTEKEKARFDSQYPGVRSYITYDEPYFKLRVGDFRTRLDAQKFLREISSSYLYSIIVVDRINFPRLADEKELMWEENPSDTLVE